ncbi:magnesium chelatase subunit H [Candidatus Chloroploca sp. M-50]|uniref:magnesium chelatase n=1 Tax=Candidatus Chloroploca mongolica TaxID=2528176 RepID=A0ABS4DEJ1_9CHLR|nr:magnesium chelatase subunit H [Candidatus Chloroploca mongolica]MBP1467874.1 magnesium chelatase subunit H [Candidatus Chloroploca mongolica]
MRIIFLTIDGNHAAALHAAAARIKAEHGVEVHAACYDAASLRDESGWQRLERDLKGAAFVFGARLFGEEYVRPLERLLGAASCPVLVITSNPALIRMTRLGKFSLAPQAEESGGMLRQWVKKLRPQGGAGEARRQLAVLRNLSKVLKLIPGKARDLYTYIVAHQYWTNSSPENVYRLVCLLIEAYVPGYKGKLPVLDPVTYPDQALIHPDAPAPFATLEEYQKWRRSLRGNKRVGEQGRVGILAMRTVALSGNTAHLDALVRALEVRGIEARMAYATGLDMRPAITTFFQANDYGKAKRGAPATNGHAATVDLLVNASGFALVGGPAESRPADARAALGALDVGYLAPVPLAFQRVEDWRNDWAGLTPVQAALSVAVPELEGAADPLVYGGPTAAGDGFVPAMAEVELLAGRIARRVALRRTPNHDKRLALVLFSFPPNLGNLGTAAYLDVFRSLHKLLQALKEEGYQVEVPEDAEALRNLVVGGNALAHGADANVAATFPVEHYMRLFPSYTEIEPCWGRAPGELLNDGRRFRILGRQLGNIFIGVQPPFGYERDPMRMLMARDAAPNHAFAAFYTWVRHTFDAHAVVHIGTHGALEFMPGKQVGLGADDWPSRLIGELPNFYLYSVNNPSEAAIAKRRSAATLVSYLVPPLQQAGLYKGLRQLKDSIDAYRQRPDSGMLDVIREQAAKLGMQQANATLQHGVGEAHATLEVAPDTYLAALSHELLQIEERMIPAGLHVFGQPPEPVEMVDLLSLTATFHQFSLRGTLVTFPELIARSLGLEYAALRERLATDLEAQTDWQRIEGLAKDAIRRFVEGGPFHVPGIHHRDLDPLADFLGDLLNRLSSDNELAGLLHGLEGGFVTPSPSNDIVRDPSVVPTGRNVYSLDPSRAPTAQAVEKAERLTNELLARAVADAGALPESVAVVLWGSDNLKSDCEGVAQVLALMGARPVPDELGNISDVTLIPLIELGRPRVDVVVTVSGIFRDLLGHQMRLIDKAARLAACADEPLEGNAVRRHALATAAELGLPLEEAATRVFANAPGSYGAHINHMVESGSWEDDEQLSETFLSRKGFTMGKGGEWNDSRPLLEKALANVQVTFQNVDSFEVGISDIDTYYESLGGVTKSIEHLRGERPAILVSDAVSTGANRVGSLDQMVRLETRAKLLNPKWYEAMLAHGYEGAREIEARLNNTYGWSATTNAVEGWVYQGVAETYALDDEMRERLAKLNPHAAAGMVRRLLEANGRGFWDADEATIERLRTLYEDLEDQLEGIGVAQA